MKQGYEAGSGNGAVAQLGEHLNGIEGVGGSSPPSSTNFLFRYEIVLRDFWYRDFGF